MTNVTRKTALTDAQIRELRREHADLRAYALAHPEDYETPHATDKTVAEDYGLTVAAVAHLAMGLNRESAGGPIDRQRAAEWLQYRDDCRTSTETTARRVRAWRKDSRNRPAAPVTVVITHATGAVETLQVPGGSQVTITTQPVTETTDADDTADN